MANSFVIIINKNGGIGGTSRFYTHASLWNDPFSDAELTTRLERVILPTKSGYICTGLWTDSTAGDGWQLVDGYGNFTDTYWNNVHPYNNFNLYCQWTLLHTITLDKNGGTGGTTTVTHDNYLGLFYIGGSRADKIVVPTRSGYTFEGYTYDGKRVIDSEGNFSDYLKSTSWNIYATASWNPNVDQYDFFGASTSYSSILMIVSSQTRDTRMVYEGTGSITYNNEEYAGRLDISENENSDRASFWRSGKLRNPVCAYKIKGSGQLTFRLGMAWNSEFGKFFLTKITFTSGADKEPMLMLEGTANEGVNAINQWNVSFNVSPHHVAQDPFSAISGGGELTECSFVASAEPVVLYEVGVPCASDITHGKITVSATTESYFGEGEPSAAGDFVETNGNPLSITDIDYRTYKIVAEKSL